MGMFTLCKALEFDSWVGKICWRRDRLPTPVFLGFPGGSAGKKLPAMRETGFNPWVGKIPLEKGKVFPLQYSCLENSMDCIVNGVAKSWTRLSDFHFLLLWSTGPRVHGLSSCGTWA